MLKILVQTSVEVPTQYQVLLQKYSGQQKRPKSPSCRSYILVSWGTAGEVTYSEQVTWDGDAC